MKALLIIWLMASGLALGALEFDSEVVEVEAPLGADKMAADFTFRNTGKETIRISHVDPDCDCIGIMVKGGKLEYQPGEEGMIRSEFEIGNHKGMVEQRVAIWLEGDPKDKPSINLTARIHIPEFIKLSEKTLKWEVGSEAEAKRIEVVMHPDEVIHVTQVSSSSPDFEVSHETVEKGRRYQILVTPKNTETPGISVIKIETDSKVEGERNKQAFAMVHRP